MDWYLHTSFILQNPEISIGTDGPWARPITFPMEILRELIYTHCCISTWSFCTVFNGLQYVPSHLKEIWILSGTVQVHSALNQLCNSDYFIPLQYNQEEMTKSNSNSTQGNLAIEARVSWVFGVMLLRKLVPLPGCLKNLWHNPLEKHSLIDQLYPTDRDLPGSRSGCLIKRRIFIYLLQFSWTTMSKGKGAKSFMEPM